MTSNIKKIISFTTTETNKSFCLDLLSVDPAGSLTQLSSREMYYADIEDENSHVLANGRYYNKGCLANLSTTATTTFKTCYSTLYNVKDLYLKSAIYGNNAYYTFPNTHTFQNVFNYKLSTDLTNQIQFDNYIYQMNTELCNIGKYSFTQDIYSELSMNNGYIQMPHELLSTCIFDQANISSAIQDPNVEIVPKTIYTNIKYNHFLEIPGNIQNDYDSGNYTANTYTTKNQYNCEYDMTHDISNILTNARRYIAIDHCNNQLYLKYYDDILYNDNTSDYAISAQLYNQNYQRLEVVKALNRFEAVNAHKTNYYDIDVVCEQLFNDFNAEIERQNESNLSNIIQVVKQNLKHEIANCIVDICKNIAPIDTQLVKVNVLENELGL